MTKARDLANIISGGLTADDIPALPASKITSGSLGADRIPDLPASKITSGSFDDARLSSSSVTQHVDLTALSASNLTSGTVPSARLSISASDVPSLDAGKVTTGTFADARISSSSVTAHVDLTALSASNLTSGTIPDARYGTPTFNGSNLTNMSVASTTGTWTPGVEVGSTDNNRTAKYVKVGKMVFCRCSFYTSGTESSRSGSTLKLTGLPFTAESNHTFAGQGPSIGKENVDGHVLVLSGTTTAVFVRQPNRPEVNIDQSNGGQARRHSLYDGVGSHYNLAFTYVSAS